MRRRNGGERKPLPGILGAGLLIAAGLLATLTGCQNPMRSLDVADTEAGTGIISLTIGEGRTARTIAPDNTDDFVRFDLDFVPAAGSGAGISPRTIEWEDGATATIELPAGTWNLTVTAFIADEEGAPIAVATGNLDGIEMYVGANIEGNVLLAPITGGTGTFRWDIIYDEADIVSAEMTIIRLDVSPNETRYYRFTSAGTGTEIGSAGFLPLEAGRYRVVFTLENSRGNVAVLGSILHVFRNMESFFEARFDDGHFQVSLSDIVLDTWDGGQWNLVDEGITARHLELVGITGVNEGNFPAVADWLNDPRLTLAVSASPTLAILKQLVDAALVGIGSEDDGFLAYDYENHAEAQNAIAGLAGAGTDITFTWASFRTVTAHVPVGGSQVSIEFVFEMAATLAEQLEWLRNVAQSGGSYLVELNSDDNITPAEAGLPGAAWNDDRSNITVTLISTGEEREVSLAQNGTMFTVPSGITLVLDYNVTLIGRTDNTSSLVNVQNGGTLVMNTGARITGNTLSGGVVGGGVNVGSGGTFEMYGGIISNNSAHSGGGVNVSGTGATFTMHGGIISNNTPSISGGGVNIGFGGVFEMHDGTIADNSTAGGGGGGVNVGYDGVFEMHGGTISNNTSPGSGGGVNIGFGGVFEMHDGTIAGNNTTGDWSSGGGVQNLGTFRISNGIIHGNESAVAESLRNTASLNGASLNISGSGTAEHGRFNDYGEFTEVLGTIPTRNLTIEVVDGVLLVPEMAGNLADQLAWLRELAQSGGSYTIKLSDDDDIAPAETGLPGDDDRSNITVTLISTGEEREVRLAQNGYMFSIPSGITLVLDYNVTLIGRGDNTSSLVNVQNGGTLVMNTGARITSNTSSGSGGGVNIGSGGVFEMHDGTIAGNSAGDWSNGGGVNIGSGGVFEMHDGTIAGNNANTGGGVSIGSDGVFEMHGGTISNNTSSTNGGGVSIGFGGVFEMHGGTIAGNNTTGDWSNGGGVSIGSDGMFEMHGGTISNNTASTGGGVNVSGTGASFTMHGGTISNNTSSSNGGGVSIGFGGVFEMHDGTIAGNNATGDGSSGGGVHIGFGGNTFVMHGGTISNNTGGGVSVSGVDNIFTMKGGEIFNNIGRDAGGVRVESGTFAMKGGEIFGNEATANIGLSSGGGVFAVHNGTFQISNGLIHGVDAEPGFANTSWMGVALSLAAGGTAQRGNFNALGTFTSLGTLTATDYTIEVVNGVLLRP